MTLFIPSRRGFICGLLSALAAPAIVHAGNIMSVRQMLDLPDYGFESFDSHPDGVMYQWMDRRVLGRDYGMVDSALRRGWNLVPASRYKKQFRMKGDTIEIGGSVLMEFPKAVYEGQRAREIAAAHNMVSEWRKQVEADGFMAEVRTNVATVEWKTIVIGERV